MTPATGILTLVRAMFSLSGAVREHLASRARLKPMQVVIKDIQPRNPEQFVRDKLLVDALFGADGRYPSLRDSYADVIYFNEDLGDWRFLPEGDAVRRGQMVAQVLEVCSSETEDWDEAFGAKWQPRDDLSPRDEFHLHTIAAWQDADESRRDRNAIILGLAQTGLSYLTLSSHRLGLGQDAQRIVAGVASGLDSYFERNRDTFVEKAFTEGASRRVMEAMLTTSLDLAADRPELFAEDDHIQTLVTAVAGPLRTLNLANRDSGLNMTARMDSLRDAIRGPVLVSVLETLHAKRTDFFGDYPEKGTAAGVVTEALFEGLVAQAQAAPDNVLSIFSGGFLKRNLPIALNAVAASPEAFIHGKGQHVLLGRDLLSSFADALNAHASVRKNPRLASELFTIGLQLTEKHAVRFATLEARAALAEWQADASADADPDDPWAAVALRMVGHIAESMITHFEVGGIRAGLIPDRVGMPLFLDLVGLLAEQAAETPGMILPDSVSPEVVRIAQGVAAFVADEHAGLLTQNDWRRVSGRAIELALQNPGALFGLETPANGADEDPRRYLAVQLITNMLSTAAGSLTAPEGAGLRRQRGHLLFGSTLAEALIVTLETAVAHVDQLTRPDTMPALMDFVRQLDAMAVGSDALDGRGLSADDWVLAFRWFASEAIANPGQPVSPQRIAALIRSAERRALETDTEPDTPPPPPGGEVIVPAPVEGAEG